MAIQNPSLGLFSKLPYELREQIWLEFLPVDQERAHRTTQTSEQTDLRVLRTSRDLYGEISAILYSRTCLHFDLSPSVSDPSLWSTIYFKSRYQRRKNTHAVWRLRSEISSKDHHFDNFPLHKIEAIEVSLFAPGYEDGEELLWLWRNVIRTAELFREASSIPPVVIQLRRSETQDWCDMKGAIRCLSKDNIQERLNYEVLILPFYNIRHLRYIKIEPHSEELGNKMDWKMIDWAGDVVSKRNGDCETGIDEVGEHEFWGKTLDDYFWAHDEIFHCRFHGYTSSTIDFLREEWMCQGFRSLSKYKIKRNGRWITRWAEVPVLLEEPRHPPILEPKLLDTHLVIPEIIDKLVDGILSEV